MNKKINILYIFHASIIGGGSFCLLNMIKKLDKECFNPIVLLKENGPLLLELENIGAIVHIEKSLSTVPYNNSLFKISSLIQLYGIITSIMKVRCWIKDTMADIVHLNTMMMHPYLLPAHFLKKKTVIHMREHWPRGEHQLQFKIAQKIIKKYADKIIAINQTSASILDIPYKTEIIYDWIDFENRDMQIPFNTLFGEQYKSLKIFVFLGGTNFMKGALEIVEIFSKELPFDNVRLLLVGSDSKIIDFNGLKGYLKKILSFFNYYTYSDKVKLIAQSDNRIVFLPSTYKIKSLLEQSYCLLSFHTTPHANLPLAEAILLGKPAIAACTTEAIEYSNNGKAALLFAMNNKEDFKRKIFFALENEKLININARIGMKTNRILFDIIRNSNLMNMLYKSIR